MTNEFVVRREEISLVDEVTFLADGGEALWFGAIEGGIVRLHAIGSIRSIRGLARRIIDHQTAAR